MPALASGKLLRLRLHDYVFMQKRRGLSSFYLFVYTNTVKNSRVRIRYWIRFPKRRPRENADVLVACKRGIHKMLAMNGRGQYFTCKLQYQQDGAARGDTCPRTRFQRLLVPSVCSFPAFARSQRLLVSSVRVLRFPGLLGPLQPYCSRVAFNHVRIWRLSSRFHVLSSSRVNAYKRMHADTCKRFNYLIRFSTAAL